MTPFKKLLLAGLLVATMVPAVSAEHLVIAAVNDTHSQIDPAADGKGGLLRRRAIYDQIRKENKNTMIFMVAMPCRARSISQCSREKWNLPLSTAWATT